MFFRRIAFNNLSATNNLFHLSANSIRQAPLRNAQIAIAHQKNSVFCRPINPMQDIIIRKMCQNNISYPYRIVTLKQHTVPISDNKREHTVPLCPKHDFMSFRQQPFYFRKKYFVRELHTYLGRTFASANSFCNCSKMNKSPSFRKVSSFINCL